MFTGLVQAVVAVRSFDGRVLSLGEPGLDDPWELGESVSVNGCCLTLVDSQNALRFELSGETLSRTTFASLAAGVRVNIERAVRVGDRLGGHIVQGHVDGVGTVVSAHADSGGGRTLVFEVPAGTEHLLADKGSITVDGVSLTVVAPQARTFGVALIPHTLAGTNLADREPGDAVNLEFDVLAKHVARILGR